MNRFVGDQPKPFVRLLHGRWSARTDIGQQADLREAGAEFVVQIAGQTRAFSLKGVLPFGTSPADDLFLELACARFHLPAKADHPTTREKEDSEQGTDYSHRAGWRPP